MTADTVAWKYERATAANTSNASFGRAEYLSNLKWLIPLALRPLIREVENWPAVLRYYLLREGGATVAIRFRNKEVLIAPRNYGFSAIAETLLVNAYRFQGSGAVVVDVGASIGDFTLLASRDKRSRVYAFEADPGYFRYLKDNMTLNRRNGVQAYQKTANSDTLISIVEQEDSINFLKLDCEGCEYEMLIRSSDEVLAKVGFIALEIHERPPYTKNNLIAHLRKSGFQISEMTTFGRGHHVYALRESPPQRMTADRAGS